MPDNKSDSTLQTEADKDEKGTDPIKTDSSSGKAFDPSRLSDEEFEAVFSDERLFNHKRFKQLNDRAKEADLLKKELEKQKEAELEKKQEWEQLAKERQQRIEEMEGKVQTQAIESAIEREANKLGAVDSEAILKLVDRQSIKYSEDGVTGVSEAVRMLLENKPYLSGKDSSRTVGRESSPGDETIKPRRFKASQLKDVEFYRANEKDIEKALMSGLIEDDLPNP